ncbi:MAG: hypothetical protein JG762_833 [Deferribacteraceae bacterium]|jgi:type IV pilus assembly protein PilW|nr:hypothetical protein [Deferribacteraceae bacterium]
MAINQNNKGVTLIELLVTVFIFSVVISAVYLTFTSLYSDARVELKKTESEIEQEISLNYIQNDLTHIGYGIGFGETNELITCTDCDNTPSINKNFSLLSLYNFANKNSFNWCIYNYDKDSDKCLNGLTPNGSDSFMFLLDNRTAYDNTTTKWTDRPTDNKTYIAVMVDDTLTNGCSSQFCYNVYYILTKSNIPQKCNPNTFGLTRALNSTGTGGIRILDCVADFTLRFDYDKNDNNLIDDTDNETSYYNIAHNFKDQFEKIKSISLYLLLQEGSYDKDFTLNQACTEKFCNGDVCLTLPDNCEHYRWKIAKISAKTMELLWED